MVEDRSGVCDAIGSLAGVKAGREERFETQIVPLEATRIDADGAGSPRL